MTTLRTIRGSASTCVRGWIDRARRRRQVPPPPPLVPNPHPEMLDWMLARIDRLRRESVPAEQLLQECRDYLERLEPPLAIQPEVLARLLTFGGQFDDDMFAMAMRFLAISEERETREAQFRTRPR